LRHPDLDPTTQAILLSAVAILAGMALIRIALFFRRQFARVPHRYPCNWTSNQTGIFEQVRMSIGVALGVTWASLELAAPWMPQSWPFGLAEMVLTVGLLLLSNAWLLLLIPSNWEHSIASKVSFGTTMGILVWWWTALLGGLLVAIALAAWPVHLTLPMGTYAQYDNSTPEPVQVVLIASSTR
jgi:hypothetical protein